MLFLQGILPLFAYVLAETFLGVRKAVLVALSLAAIEIIWSRYSLGYFEEIGILSAGLILVMGAVSYRMNSPLMIKMQPVVLGFVFAGILAYYQFFDQPLIYKFIPMMKTMMDPAQFRQFENPVIYNLLGRLCGQLIGVLILHALLVGVAAFRWSRWTWLMLRSFGIYPMIFILVVINFLFV